MDENGHQPPDEPVVRNQVLGPQNREIQRESGNKKNLDEVFFLGWNQNESKMHQKHRNGWKIRKNKTKQIDFFVVFPQKINQEGESERGELNKYTNQKVKLEPHGLPLHLHRHLPLSAWGSISADRAPSEGK